MYRSVLKDVFLVSQISLVFQGARRGFALKFYLDKEKKKIKNINKRLVNVYRQAAYTVTYR